MFAEVEKIIPETFLPRLFFGKMKTLFPIVGTPVKKSGQGLLNPVTSSQEKYLRYQWGSAELVWAVTGGEELSNADHLRALSEERRDGEKNRDAAYESKTRGLVSDLKGTDNRLLICTKSTGAWLIVCGTTVSFTVLSATELYVITSLP